MKWVKNQVLLHFAQHTMEAVMKMDNAVNDGNRK